MDQKDIKIGIMLVKGNGNQPPPPELIPYILKATEAHHEYRSVMRLTRFLILYALFLVVTGNSAKTVLLFTLGAMLVETALRGFNQWSSARALDKAAASKR